MDLAFTRIPGCRALHDVRLNLVGLVYNNVQLLHPRRPVQLTLRPILAHSCWSYYRELSSVVTGTPSKPSTKVEAARQLQTRLRTSIGETYQNNLRRAMSVTASDPGPRSNQWHPFESVTSGLDSQIWHPPPQDILLVGTPCSLGHW
jgi:hypothetical protein